MPERAGWLVLALILNAMIGDPEWLWRRIKHPVVLCNQAVTWLEERLNKGEPQARRLGGLVAVLALLVGAALTGWLVECIAALLPVGALLEIAVAAVFLAQGSLAQHVRAVARGLAESLEEGRRQVARIAGGDTRTLDESGVARTVIEATADRFADGVVAPVLFYLVLGLPGLLAYKAVSIADSILDRRNERYEDFGCVAAKLAALANYIPARLSGLLLVAAAFLDRRDGRQAFNAMVTDAGKHNSPNAGWPEAAMAGALDLSLAGPRTYGGEIVMDAWMHPAGRRDCGAADIHAALRLFWLACAVQGVTVALIWLVF